MQVCALLSQLHRHKEALGHAKVAISIAHYLVKDIHKLVKYYVNRFKSPTFNFANEMLAHDDVHDGSPNNNAVNDGRVNRSQGDNADNKHIDFLYDPQPSLLAKTAIKLLPIVEELEHKLVKESLVLKESLDEFNNAEPVKAGADRHKQHKPADDFNTVFDKIDMRNLLGYLNQSDWIWSLNIGNIMQISPLTMQDIYTTSSIEYELSRELVLEKI